MIIKSWSFQINNPDENRFIIFITKMIIFDDDTIQILSENK
jgi:hypothetical protein